MYDDERREQSDDLDLARRLHEGDGYAFEEFIERFLPRLFGAAIARGEPPDAAERAAEIALLAAVAA